MAIDKSQATDLPPGFRILNDGPGREVLVDDRKDDPAPIFPTREEAAAKAWEWWRDIYEPLEIVTPLEADTDDAPTIGPPCKHPERYDRGFRPEHGRLRRQMTAPEFRAALAALAWPDKVTAAVLGCGAREIRRWKAGTLEIPERVAECVRWAVEWKGRWK